MAITDVMNQLEKQVADATAKQKAANDAQHSAELANKAYSDSLAKVEELKTQLTTAIGNIFPSSRIRTAA